MMLGALLIQKEYSYSDEETILQIQENPYLQFFIGLLSCQDENLLMRIRWCLSENRRNTLD